MVASHIAPRALPKGCSFGKEVLQLWIASYAQLGRIEALDPIVTRKFKNYVRSRTIPPADDSCEVVLFPGWALAEPHFADGFRYYGHRGSEDESDDRPHFHSQLYSARAHKERADWSLIRSLKLSGKVVFILVAVSWLRSFSFRARVKRSKHLKAWPRKMFLPLDYGPPSARNVLPRSTVDLTRRMLSLQLGPFEAGPMRFGVAPSASGASGSGASARRWRLPVDALDALQNSMIESFDLGSPKLLVREAALPGEASWVWKLQNKFIFW